MSRKKLTEKQKLRRLLVRRIYRYVDCSIDDSWKGVCDASEHAQIETLLDRSREQLNSVIDRVFEDQS